MSASVASFTLNFEKALQDIKANAQYLDIYASYERKHGPLTYTAFKEAIAETEKAYLDFDFLRPAGVSHESASEFIRLLFINPYVVLEPVQRYGVSLQMHLGNTANDKVNIIHFESFTPKSLQEYYSRHIVQLVDMISKYSHSKLNQIISSNVSSFNSHNLIYCIRAQEMFKKGMAESEISLNLNIELSSVRAYINAYHEKLNPMPGHNIIAKMLIRKMNLITAADNANAGELAKIIYIICEAEKGIIGPEHALNELMKIWKARESVTRPITQNQDYENND